MNDAYRLVKDGAAMNRATNAFDRFLEGNTCTQAILSEYADQFGFDPETAVQKNFFKTICPKFVKTSAALLEEMIFGTSK